MAGTEELLAAATSRRLAESRTVLKLPSLRPADHPRLTFKTTSEFLIPELEHETCNLNCCTKIEPRHSALLALPPRWTGRRGGLELSRKLCYVLGPEIKPGRWPKAMLTFNLSVPDYL